MKLSVLVVDDDFRVAQIHARYVESVGALSVGGTARSAAQARELIALRPPDLVLLDNYLPDGVGVELARELRCDFFMVTADRSPATVSAAISAGAVNYVVKPFPALTLTARLASWVRYREMFGTRGGGPELDQGRIDRMLATLRQADRSVGAKGRSPVTERLVTEHLASSPAPQTATDIAAALGIARATAQRYLAGLADSGQATMAMRYGTTGRPEHLYSWNRD